MLGINGWKLNGYSIWGRKRGSLEAKNVDLALEFGTREGLWLEARGLSAEGIGGKTRRTQAGATGQDAMAHVKGGWIDCD